MKTYRYTVYFGEEAEIVITNGFRNAVILGCAARIECGLHIRAWKVTRWGANHVAEESIPIDPQNSVIVMWEDGEPKR